ncbi:hypothetical protein INT47_008640 [Mucor saturninus]|uniref:Arb2 domain-containing protein n=1 Tax=Mucor saturninus TaxID=64648 RepID=A0A8H7QTN8_9FUNG|nr:hypothetical protein INT47_008640 [Mucor saturninus]
MYRRRKIVKEEKPVIPDNIRDFGYVVKDNGEIRSIHRDEPYEFDYLPKDRPYNEERYKKFIDLVGDVVEEKLQAAPYNFQKVIVPIGADPTKDVHSYIYMTPNAMTTTGKVIVFIPGNHTRIGQWSRRVMCDESIVTGSMMHITDLVREKGYEVIILNSNGNYWYDNRAWDSPKVHCSEMTVVPENDNPENHCQYVFHNFIRNVKAEKVAVLAMGWGGHSFTLALNNEFDFIKDRVKAVAMTNSVHARDLIEGDGRRAFMFDNCVNWVVSNAKKGETVQDLRFGCTSISSELEIADFTLNTMLDDIMKFIYIKMGDIEPVVEESDEEDDENRELTKEELAELDNIDMLSVE